MKIVFCADIHRDAGSADERVVNLVAEKPDVLVHCGDLSSWFEWERSLQWLRKTFTSSKILLVPGNHDFYCRRRIPMPRIVNEQHDLCKMYDICYLQRENYRIKEDLYVVGSSLWYDYSFTMDRDYSDQEIEGGYSNGTQWNDMLSIDAEDEDPLVAQKMLVELRERVDQLPKNSKFFFVSHTCPHEELNAHPPSLFNAYSGHRAAGKYLDSLGERLIASYCGHTHRPARFGKYTNLGSDYFGPAKYSVALV